MLTSRASQRLHRQQSPQRAPRCLSRQHTRQQCVYEKSCRRPARARTIICHAEAPSMQPEEPTRLERLADAITINFPLWVTLGAILGICKPAAVTWFSSALFTSALSFLMFSMGLSLTFQDFRACAKNPGPALLGYFGQYAIKPFLGYSIAQAMQLPDALAVGLILVSCCPGGQLSNVATFIAGGDVVLSVIMTIASTIGAIVMTPFLTHYLAGTLIPMDALAMAQDLLWVVLIPTCVGVLANEFCNPIVSRIRHLLPLVGVVFTTMLASCPVGHVASYLKSDGLRLCAPVALLHAAAFLLGYLLCKGFNFSERTARTVSLETGMQSAALGFVLAQQHFPDHPLVAVPSAVSVVFMAIGGSSLASYWRQNPIKEADL